ncbi:MULTISPECIES: hypothetical protein [Comamonas]|uniref:hypothetical protein n=1 Tax=Comamonas TaxID=283 RepID=UPI0011E849E8|nr:hypothetical protein [Comamonas sp. Z1]BCX53034.1 hypothetical protein CTYAZ2_26160 [Comamonas testosteroni]
MARYMADEKESSFFSDVLKISLGVFIGGLLAALAYTKIMAIAAEYAAQRVVESIELSMREQAEKARKQAEMARLQAEHQRFQREVEEGQRRANAERERQAKQEHEAFMRQEWKKIYQPSAACQQDSTTMNCVNAYAAAHKIFLNRFGEFPPRF